MINSVNLNGKDNELGYDPEKDGGFDGEPPTDTTPHPTWSWPVEEDPDLKIPQSSHDPNKPSPN